MNSEGCSVLCEDTGPVSGLNAVACADSTAAASFGFGHYAYSWYRQRQLLQLLTVNQVNAVTSESGLRSCHLITARDAMLNPGRCSVLGEHTEPAPGLTAVPTLVLTNGSSYLSLWPACTLGTEAA